MTVSVTRLVLEIDRIYASADREQAEKRIEYYLQHELQSLNDDERQRVVAALQRAFAPAADPGMGGEPFLRFCSLLLGRPISPSELSSEQMMKRLTSALDTVFSSLNELVLSINMTLLEEGQSDETIRHIIGRQLEDDRVDISLEEYIGKIKTAFLVSHQAFKLAAQEMVARILHELDPAQLSRAKDSGFKLGMMKKADSFERYNQAFTNCKKWYDSGGCMEEFLRKFEKQCYQLSQHGNRS